MSHTAVAAPLQVAAFKWSRAGLTAALPQGSRTLPVTAAAAAPTPAATSAATPPTLSFDIALTGRATVASAPTAVASPPTAAKNTCESGPISCVEEVEAASDVVDRWPAAQPARQPTGMCGFQLQRRFSMERLRRKLGLPPLRTARVRPTAARPVSLNLEQHIGRARDALLAKIDRVRLPKRRPRSFSLPGRRSSSSTAEGQRSSSAAPCAGQSVSTVDLSRLKSEQLEEQRQQPLEPGLSTTSVETSHTFRFRRPESYENILLTERRRCRSEVSLDSGDEVLARLRAMDRSRGFSRLQPDLSLPVVSKPVEVVRPMRARKAPPPRPPQPRGAPSRATSATSLHTPLPTLKEEKLTASPPMAQRHGSERSPQPVTKRNPLYREPVHPTTPPPPPPPQKPLPKSMSSLPTPQESSYDITRRSVVTTPSAPPSSREAAPKKPPRSRSPRVSSPPPPPSPPSTAPSSLLPSDFSGASTPVPSGRDDGDDDLSSPKSSGYDSPGSPGQPRTLGASIFYTLPPKPKESQAEWWVNASQSSTLRAVSAGPESAPTAPPRTLRRRKRPRVTSPNKRTSVFREAFQSSIRNLEVQDVDNGFFENFAQLPRRQEYLKQTSLDQAEESLRDLVVPLSFTDGAVRLRDEEAITPEQSHETVKASSAWYGMSVMLWDGLCKTSQLLVATLDSVDRVVPWLLKSPQDVQLGQLWCPHLLEQDVISLDSWSEGLDADALPSVELAQEETGFDATAEELYVDALHTVRHPLGCDSPDAELAKSIEQQLQELFSPSDDQQAACLRKLDDLGTPDICLSCTVLGAKGLKAKDVNGLSDPYCMLFINNEERRETHVCQRTLNPTWNESFKLALENTRTDVLKVEIWDFDMDENLAQRIGKFSDIKGVKGFTRYMKEVAKGKSHDTLGHVLIPLNELPVLGTEQSYKLQGRARDPSAKERSGRPEKERGSVQLKLRFHNVRVPENNPEAITRHERLRLAVVGAARRRFDGAAYTWQGEFLPAAGRCLLDQHAARCNLSRAEMVVAGWSAYVEVHCAAPIDYKFLFAQLQSVKQCFTEGDATARDVSRFLDTFQRFTDHCYETIHMHRHLFNSQSTATYYSIEYLLRCLVIMSEFSDIINKMPVLKDLPTHLSSVVVPNEEKVANPKRHVLSALRHGNEDWYRHVYASTKRESEEQTGQDARCQSLILLINMLYADVKRGLESYNQIFSRILGINYFSIAYLQFAEKVGAFQLEQEIGPIVAEISRSLPTVEYREGAEQDLSSPEGLDMGTSLFELYLAVQLFTSLRDQLPEPAAPGEEPPLQNAHLWFANAVNRWLDIACYKAMHRIKRAIELDQATQVHTFVNHSSSAVDTVAVFYQIKTFWKQLSWPDPIGSYGFVTKVLDDITRSATFYVAQMHRHLKTNRYFCTARPFNFTQELCLALNNVEFVREQINPLPNELGFETVFSAMEEQLGSQGTIQCRVTLQNVIDQAIEDMEHGIADMVDGSVAQMLPQVHSYLAQLAQPHCHLVPADNIISYLDGNLMLLYPRLHPLNLRRVLQSIWLQVLQAVVDTTSRQSKKETEYFGTISSLVNALVEFINGDDKGLSMDLIHTDTYKKFVHWVNVYKCDPERLIAMYYSRKYDLQQAPDNPDYGLLAVKAFFIDNVLRVEVLNARGIKSSDPDTCDAYVKVQLLPETLAPTMEKLQTKVQKKTVYPLFDEVFEFSVDRDLLVSRDCHLVFTVKDHHTLVESELLGEAVLPLSQLRGVPFNQARSVEQQLLPLSPVRMRAEQQEVHQALLDKSSWSPVAAEFVRKLSKRLRRGAANPGAASASISRLLFKS